MKFRQFNIDTLLLPKLQFIFQFCQFVPVMFIAFFFFFSSPRFHPGSHTVSSLFSLLQFGMCPQPFFVFHDTVMTFLLQLLMFCIRTPLCLSFSAVSSSFGSCLRGKEYHRDAAVFFSGTHHVCHIGKHMMSACLLTRDVNCDRLVKAGCLPGFFAHKATVFPFVINQLSGRKTLEDNVNIRFSLKLALTNFVNH